MAVERESHKVTSAEEMRALAHPLRLRLLGLLRVDGPATASSLGQRLGESSGVTSYHLRYLAERDFVEEAPELGNRRERWWRASQWSTEWDPADFLDSREGRAADLAFRREALRHSRAVVDTWLIEEETWPRRWISAALMSDAVLRLTVDQLEAFGAEYQDLLMRYVQLSDDNEAGHTPSSTGSDSDAIPEPGADASETQPHEESDAHRVYVILHGVPFRGDVI